MKQLKLCFKLLVPCLLAIQVLAVAKPPAQGAAQKVRPIGVVTAIQPGQLTLHTDAGPSLTVHLPDGVSVLQVPPGAKSLKEANKIAVSDIHMGDRVLIIGPISANQKSVTAKSVLVMSKTSLAKAREAERLEWEKHGIAGVVKALNPAAKQITLSVPNVHPKPGDLTHSVVVTLAPNASMLRYAPDSVRFRDAKPAPFSDIQVGDQMRALGTKSPNGMQFTAEKVVSGTFRNIGATVISVDASKGTIKVKDLANGKPLLVRTDANSKLHELTPRVAETIARFNAGGAAKGAPGQHSPGQSGERAHMASRMGHERLGSKPGEGSMPGGESANFNQMLQHMPALSLSSLKPGEPLIVVSTEGSHPGEVTAIAILSGVEPILRARPKGSKQVALGPWNMSAGGGTSGGGGTTTTSGGAESP